MNLNKRTVETKHVHNDQNENQITTIKDNVTVLQPWKTSPA